MTLFVRFLRFMLCFALLAGDFQCVLAQNIPPYSLQGTLLDTTGKQIADQSVCLYRDSTLVTITVSGSDGRFLFGKLTPGGYRLVVVRPGYSPVSQTIQVTDAPLTRDLSLVAGVTQLKEVTVTARKPEVEIKPDRVVVNLEANGLLAGQTVLDAFAVAPRAMLDAITKTIQVDGQPVTQLYVNDKRVALPANGVSAYLQTLPASTYTRMEILTVPPASYDASGGSVVLLYTKRPPTDGLTGDLQLSLGYGRYEKANASGNMSWKMARHSGFAVLTPLWKPTYFQYVSHQNLGGTGYSDAEQFRTNRQASLGFQSGIDVTLSPKTTVGAALNASTMHYQLRPDAWVHYQVSGQPSVGIHSISVSDQQYRQASLNLNLRHILPTGGRVSVDGDWAGFSDRHQTGSEFTRQVNSGPVNESVTIFYPTTMKIASLKADYARTVHGVTWESGIKYSLVAMQNQPVAEKVSSGFEPLKSALTLAYHYREQTAAIYGSAAFSWQSWSVNAGLRTEATWYSGQSSGTGSEPLLVSRQYTYLFPTLSLSYPLSKQVQLTLAANRRIVRPNFDLLNPAYLILDAITYVQGNPFLRPTLNTTYQAVLQLPKRISLSLIHLDAKQRLVEVLYRSNTQSANLTNTTINFDRERRTTLSLSLPLQLNRIWQMNSTVQGYHITYLSSFGNELTQLSQWVASLRMSHTLTLGKWQASMAFVGRTRAVVGYLHYIPLAYVDMALVRPISPKSTLKFSLTDVFRTLRITNSGQYIGNDLTFRHRFETRVLMVSFSHKFGSTGVKSFNRRTVGSESEQERARKD